MQMPPLTVDMRSDTVTRPTPGMRRAMAEAEVGDDVFQEDPTVQALESRIAGMFGKEAGLFVPSGTMANQLAIRVHTSPGDEVIAGRYAHSYLYEVGGAAALSGVQITVVGQSGLFTVEDVLPELRATNIHHSVSRLIMIENTHNRGGGRIFPLDDIRALRQLARERGMRVHMDGARVLNACTATGIAPEVYGAEVDTLCLCLSKGLGAPVGSVLVGNHETIALARRYRKMFGGGMRQVGILAAAGLYALDHHVAGLADDHARAQTLAHQLAALPGVSFEHWPETNILIFKLERPDLTAAQLCERLRAEGIGMLPMDGVRVRAVLHREIDGAHIQQACQVLRRVLSES